MTQGRIAHRVGVQLWRSAPVKWSTLFLTATIGGFYAFWEYEWSPWVAGLLFCFVMASGLLGADKLRFLVDESGITIPKGRGRDVYLWDQIRSVHVIHRWQSNEPGAERHLRVKWSVRGFDGEELFRFDPSLPGAEKLAQAIESHVEPWEPEPKPLDPKVSGRMQTLFPEAKSAQSVALECAKCGTLIDRSDMTRIGALRVDEATCVCPACLRRGKKGR